MNIKLPILFLGIFVACFSTSLHAQNSVYTDSFTQGVPPTTAQINAWDNWRASLKPGQYTYMTIKGTFDQTGITCTDKTIVNAFATAVQNYQTYISSSTGGHVWSICNRYLGEIWLDPPSSCSGSNCPGPNGYIIRPGIGTGNSNWGGVNTNTCSGATQRMTFIFGKPSKPNEMGVASLSPLDICNYTQSITAKISNYGTNYVDSFRLYWSVNNVMQTPLYVTSHLKSGIDTSIMLKAGFSLNANTTYNFKIWTHRPNGLTDSIPSNDTLLYTLAFMGNPNPPLTNNILQCGNGRPMLQATPDSPADSILWYTASSGGTLLGMGKNLQGPMTTKTTTFYAQAMKLGARVTHSTGAANTGVNITQSNYYGGMLNITTTPTVMVDSITVRLWYNASPSDFKLYYKTGTYNGFETNSAAWTLVNQGRARFFISGGQYFARVSAKSLLLAPSTTYSFYYTVDISGSGVGNSLLSVNPGATVSSPEMTISSAGTIIIGLFGTTQVLANYRPYMEFMYRKQCTNSNRSAYTVTVKPRPTGSDIVKGPTFQGQFRVGDNTFPDVIEAGKTMIYEIVPPTGYSNAGHNNTWVINNVVARTKYGVLVPATEYSVSLPSGSTPGRVTFIPKSVYLDSFITFSINYSDLGPYFCDSTIRRTVVVAPTPWPNFKFPASICLGDIVLFDNTTTIKSGNATYMWYFGNGDSSDLQSPVYEYKASGVYNIRLVAKSFPWNVIHDTTITVEIGELPITKFRVNNKCQGIAVSFQNQTTVANGTLTYDWDFGDGTPHSNATNPTHLYSAPGGYKVTLKASANGCVSTLVKNAYMFARPVANFIVPVTPACARTEVFMPNTSTIALGNQGAFWNFGDGDGSTQFHGAHPYAAPGTYQVKLLAVSEFDCRDSITKAVVVKPAPSPDFTADQLCGKKPTVFRNNTTEDLPNPVYTWTFSDNYSSTLKHVTRTWPVEGPYSVTLKADYSNGCSGSITKDFEVLIQPKADFTVEDICSGETAEFVNLSQGDRGGIEYNWDFGNGTYSTLAAPVILYNPAGTSTYTITLAASYPGACSDTVRRTITVSEAPVCDFTYKDLGFLKARFTPSNTTYTKYEWFFGEGGTSKSATPDYQYKYAGKFKVTMSATNVAGCTCQITKAISATTDINRLNASGGINIFPNPTQGVFHVSNASGQGMHIEVYNALGDVVYSINTTEDTSKIDLRNFAKGLYNVKVDIAGTIYNASIILTD